MEYCRAQCAFLFLLGFSTTSSSSSFNGERCHINLSCGVAILPSSSWAVRSESLNPDNVSTLAAAAEGRELERRGSEP